MSSTRSAGAGDRGAASAHGGPQQKSRGPGMIIVAVYGLFSLSAGARAAYQIATKFDEAPLSFVLSAIAAVVYVAATVALATRGIRAYWAAVATIGVELLGVLGVGTFSFLRPELFPLASVWSHFGSGYGYVPLVLPVVGLLWLYRNRPGRIAAR